MLLAVPVQRARPSQVWTVWVDLADVAGCLHRLQAAGWHVRSANRRWQRVQLDLERDL